jgi:hypothetical protein
LLQAIKIVTTVYIHANNTQPPTAHISFMPQAALQMQSEVHLGFDNKNKTNKESTIIIRTTWMGGKKSIKMYECADIGVSILSCPIHVGLP